MIAGTIRIYTGDAPDPIEVESNGEDVKILSVSFNGAPVDHQTMEDFVTGLRETIESDLSPKILLTSCDVKVTTL